MRVPCSGLCFVNQYFVFSQFCSHLDGEEIGGCFTLTVCLMTCYSQTGLDVIKLEYVLKLKIKCNNWLLVDMCPQAANHCALLCV